MSKNVIYGYKYNENNKKLDIIPGKIELVKITYDLAVCYKLNVPEIVNLFNGTETLSGIIANRIYDIYEIAHKYNKNTGKNIEDKDIKNILDNNDNIKKIIIEPLLKVKERLDKIDFDKQSLFEDIENVIELINKKDELFNKYGDLKKIGDRANTSYLEDDFEYKPYIWKI